MWNVLGQNSTECEACGIVHSDTVAVKEMNGNDDNKVSQVLMSYHAICVGLRVGVGRVARKLLIENGRSDSVAVKHAIALRDKACFTATLLLRPFTAESSHATDTTPTCYPTQIV
ncbi:hypothetical protein Y032_0249g114 [Ancylostoma ceylanicum]|uniref:Uncharacterized protein n=1 Tax=Ancylostoma ceylanicum TaxID=53326 RepID=A0A016SDD1_9BILA|nr:hypothetical protein Y032_0249g114 [Ancylostoma ceylanicum]